jgi:hypothetical protein
VEDASPEYEALNPAKAEQEVAEKTAAALDVARFGVDQLLADLTVTGESLYQMIKQAHLRDGVGILQIAQAVGQAMQDPAFATEIMKRASARLEIDGIRFDQAEEMRKIAHPLVVNTGHPLLEKAAILEKLAFSYYSSSEIHQDLQQRHRQTHTALRDKLRGT